EAEELDQRVAGRGHRVARADRRLGLDINDQAVEVGALLDTRRLDGVRDLQDRRVNRVDWNATDLLARLLVLDSRDVSATTLDGEVDLKAALLVDRRDQQVGVVNRHTGRR